MRSTLALLVSLLLLACHEDSDSTPVPAPEPLVINLGLAAERVIGRGELRVVAVPEEAEGRDLDGDGDATGVVVHLLDLASGSLVNTGLALPPRPVLGGRDVVPPPEPACNDAFALFPVSEAETGLDLDQDGIPGEVATWAFDRSTGALRSLPFVHTSILVEGEFLAMRSGFGLDSEVHVLDVRDGSLTTLPGLPAGLLEVGDGLVAFVLGEGGGDLNGDGDALDQVVQVYDVRTRSVRNTGLAMAKGALRIVAGFVGFAVREADQGGLDLNDDGDAVDRLFVAVEGRTGLLRLPGFPGADFASFEDPEQFLLAVREDDDGVGDGNGDGDAEDTLALAFDPVGDRVQQPALALAPSFLVRSGPWIGLSVDEGAQGLDLDADGRLQSLVLHVHDTRSGRSRNLGLSGLWSGTIDGQLLGVRTEPTPGGLQIAELVAFDARSGRLLRTGSVANGPLGFDGSRALVFVLERQEDLNGDGDVLDLVLALYDGRTATVRSLAIATSTLEGSLGPDGKAAVLVSEAAQGADLNGDGDLLDQVLHLVSIEEPRG